MIILRFLAFFLVFDRSWIDCLPFVDFVDPEFVPSALLPVPIHPEKGVDFPAACDWEHYEKCLQVFYVDGDVRVHGNVTELKEGINDALTRAFFNGGSSGASRQLLKICRAEQNLYGECLGETQALQCMTSINYMQHGINSNNGFGYQMLFTRLHFQCGVAFPAYVTHATDLALTPGNNATQQQLDQCLNAFITGLSDFPHTPPCPYLKTFNECMGSVYYEFGCDKDFAWSVCEASRLANVVTLPMCMDSQYKCKLDNLTNKNCT